MSQVKWQHVTVLLWLLPSQCCSYTRVINYCNADDNEKCDSLCRGFMYNYSMHHAATTVNSCRVLKLLQNYFLRAQKLYATIADETTALVTSASCPRYELDKFSLFYTLCDCGVSPSIHNGNIVPYTSKYVAWHSKVLGVLVLHCVSKKRHWRCIL